MAREDMSATMAVFFDLENIVIGARQADYPKFNIKRVLDRLVAKGNIVVKKAYCDWDRYKDFKRALHEAAFELIEVPHVNQSGKNSADIRMVVDALDLCYTKGHVDTFVILSGDSDFSPLVSKLRENAKKVIGLGVKNSSSDLFISNCDEFIYYDDLVRAEVAANRPQREAPTEPKKASTKRAQGPKVLDARPALQLVKEIVEVLAEERGERPIQTSMVKDALKRRDPGFNEKAFGYKTITLMLEAAAKEGLIRIDQHEKSGTLHVRPRDGSGE
jgi:uncharacterized protein (TIGR00288 family)